MALTQYKKTASYNPPKLLIQRFCLEYDVSESEARERFEETKKFLALCASRQGGDFSPSAKIDAMWHQFILHTRDYVEFCDAIGGYIHHQPSEAPQPAKYEKTRRALKRHFGTLNENYWGVRSADCDSSSCDCCP